MNLEKIVGQVRELSLETGVFVQAERRKLKGADVESKGVHDYVTYVDKASEERLTRGLEKIFPQAGFIAEEGTSTKIGKEWNWVVDPIDGTTNYIHGIPCYCISIALMKGKQTVLGVVDELNFKESFYAWEGSAAYLNEDEIKVSAAPDLGSSLLATGFPYTDFGMMDEYLDLFKYFMYHSRGLRRLGSAAADLVYVACGRFDAFYEYGLKPWDVAAGAFIVKQAGGRVTDFQGGNNFDFGQEIIASNENVHESMLKAVKASGMVKQ